MILLCFGQEKALLQVIVFESEIETHEHKLTGHFSAVGTVGAAEGVVKQVCRKGNVNLFTREEDLSWPQIYLEWGVELGRDSEPLLRYSEFRN